MNLISKLFGKGKETIAHTIDVGDIVVQYRHYEFDKNRGAILMEGPQQGLAGTKWRFKGIGKTKAEINPPPGWHYSGPGGEESYVELELVEGEYQHRAPYEQSELPENRIERLKMMAKGKTVSESSGYTMKINNAPAYRQHFPDKNPLQQFFEEWKKME